MGGLKTYKAYCSHLWTRWDTHTIKQEMLWDIPGGPSKPHLYSLKLHQFGDFQHHFIARKDGRTDNFSRLENKHQNMFVSISSTWLHIKTNMLCRWRYDEREWKSFLCLWCCIQAQEPNFLLVFCTHLMQSVEKTPSSLRACSELHHSVTHQWT